MFQAKMKNIVRAVSASEGSPKVGLSHWLWRQTSLYFTLIINSVVLDRLGHGASLKCPYLLGEFLCLLSGVIYMKDLALCLGHGRYAWILLSLLIRPLFEMLALLWIIYTVIFYEIMKNSANIIKNISQKNVFPLIRDGQIKIGTRYSL